MDALEKKNLKGTWPQAILSFLFPLLLLGFLRWAVFEPFVIPSGSMIPNLLIHDHVLVKKFSFGLKFPFTDHWLIQWSQPERGDVVVFKYPKNTDVYYIKRLIGKPGDHIQFRKGQLSINDQAWGLQPTNVPAGADEDFDYYIENSGHESHIVRYRKGDLESKEDFDLNLKDDEFFMMGDNRDESLDSRYWGTVHSKLLVAPAWKILLGCEETLASNSMVCNPMTLKKGRLWKDISL